MKKAEDEVTWTAFLDELRRRHNATEDEIEKFVIKRMLENPSTVVESTSRLLRREVVKTHYYQWLATTKNITKETRAQARNRALLKPSRFVIRFLFSKDQATAIEGDLLERYDRDVKELGPRLASFLFYKQWAISLWPLVKRTLYKLGALAWITSLVRRWIG